VTVPEHNEKMHTVLIFDAEHRISLTLARNFHKNGYAVVLLSQKRYARSFYSKSCDRYFVSSYRDLKRIQNIVKQIDPCMIIPVLDESFEVAYALQKKGQPNILPLPDYVLFSKFRDKSKTIDFLRLHSLPSPKTILLKDALAFPDAELKKVFHDSKIIIKPRIASSGRGIILCKGIQYLDNARARYQKNIKKNSKRFSDCDFTDPLLQEYIDGEHYSFNMVFRHGELLMQQLVRHLKYFPPVFGSPIVSRTEEITGTFFGNIISVFKKIRWHGVVHCDLIYTHDGSWYINEVNPRFWGTLENTFLSGIDMISVVERLWDKQYTTTPATASNYDYEYRHFIAAWASFLKPAYYTKGARVKNPGLRRERKWNIDRQDIFPHVVHFLRALFFRDII
jgi:predicted ATP-grasp superfamily ATP-dependent carboligase